MDESLLSWYQALQLLALGPCLFMVFFLGVASRKIRQVLVPMMYFLSLSCSFVLPLTDLLGFDRHISGMLILASSAEPAISFLLIVQFMSGDIPKLPYWAILAVPVLGGGQMIYATLVTDGEVCIYEHICAAPELFRKLYEIFSISLTCLLTLLIYRRINRESAAKSTPWETQQKYALVLALVALNLTLLGIDLSQMANYTNLENARLAKTFVRIGFIYLVLTSVFRVFDRAVELNYMRIPSIKPDVPNARDLSLAESVKEIFTKTQIYRDMELNRERLATALKVNEATLSRAVNKCFNENVSMLINRYRVDEAKTRLAFEMTSITVIAFEVGFSSIPSFNRVFKQLSGMSPTEYRQRQSAGSR